MKSIWIVSAKRTPQGRFLGALGRHSAVALGVVAARAALAGLEAACVDSVIVGNVLGAGLGMNVARQIALGAGLPVSTPAFTVNMMCASGMQAVILATQAIQSGAARVVLCGGAESMSNAPYLLNRARSGYKLGDGVLIDSLLRDGLTDAFSDEPMGVTTEDSPRTSRFPAKRRIASPPAASSATLRRWLADVFATKSCRSIRSPRTSILAPTRRWPRSARYVRRLMQAAR